MTLFIIAVLHFVH